MSGSTATPSEISKQGNADSAYRRCYSWSRFYNALPWIGSKSSLVSAELSLIQNEPFGAFDWLKEFQVMNVHGKWRSNVMVSSDIVPIHYLHCMI
jgi:hypothetical protein